jgi:hypothetical protein
MLSTSTACSRSLLLLCRAVPLQAFAGLDLSGYDAATLLSIVTYHFCPDTQPWKLVVRVGDRRC